MAVTMTLVAAYQQAGEPREYGWEVTLENGCCTPAAICATHLAAALSEIVPMAITLGQSEASGPLEFNRPKVQVAFT